MQEKSSIGIFYLCFVFSALLLPFTLTTERTILQGKGVTSIKFSLGFKKSLFVWKLIKLQTFSAFKTQRIGLTLELAYTFQFPLLLVKEFYTKKPGF